MPDESLHGLRILVVEDEYMIADALCRLLECMGATILGPAPSAEHAQALLDKSERIDLAILDVNLDGDAVYPLADRLAERGTAFVFTTGYDSSRLPGRFADVPFCQKPVSRPALLSAILAAAPPATLRGAP